TRFSRDWSSDVCSSDLYTPVAPISHHIIDTFPPPGWNPAYIVNSLQCLLAKTFNRGKPLFRSAVDYRVLASPAIRVLVLNFSSRSEEHTSELQSREKLV